MIIGIGVSSQPAISVETGDGTVTLTGNTGSMMNPTHVDVYRGTTNPPTTIHETFVPSGTDYTWEDADVNNGIFYYYQIKARDENAGTETFSSNLVGGMPDEENGGSHFIFDGVDDKVEQIGGQYLSTVFAMEFDFKIEELTAGKNNEIFRLVFDEPNAPVNKSAINVFHNDERLRIYFRRTDNFRSVEFYIDAHDVADGNWHTIRFEAMHSSSIVVFVDDVRYSVWINVFGSGSSLLYFGKHDISLGGRSNATTTFLNGAIDNLRIWDLSSNLLGDWKLDEPSTETTVFDSSPEARNMTKVSQALSSSDDVSMQSFATNTGTDQIASSIDYATPFMTSFKLERQTLPSGPTVTIKEDLDLIDFFPYADNSTVAGTPYEYTITVDRMDNSTVTVSDVTVPATGFGTHYTFDGIDDDVTLDEAIIDGIIGTIEFLVKIAPEDKPSGFSYALLGKHESGSSNGFIIAHDGGTVWCQFKEEGSNTGNLYPAPSQNLADGTWHHVALTFEVGNSGTLYVDGEAAATNSIPSFTFTENPLFIGNGPNAFWQPLKGGIDEVVVWDKVLSAEEIEGRAFAKVRGDADGLLAAYHFDEASGTVAYDDGLNNEHATISGATVGQTTDDIPIQWKGTLSSEWGQPSNWNIGTTPSAGKDLIITAANNAPVISTGDEVDVNNLTVNSGATLTVESEGILAIREGATVNGTYTVERRPEGVGRYSMIGSPLSDADISDFAASQVYAYDEATSIYDLFTSGLAQPGKGFFVAFPAAETDPVLSLTGTPNTGTIVADLSRESITGDHYNLVANPYAAPLNYGALIANNSAVIEESIWLWDDGDANFGDNRIGDYMVVNNVGIISSTGSGVGSTGSMWNGFIGSFQGFFVRANELAVGNLTFTPDMQVASQGSNNDQNHFRVADDYPYHSIKLSLSGEGLYNELIVALSDEATFGRDRLDAEKIKGNPYIAFYSLQEDETYAIQGLPIPGPSEGEMSVQLGFDLAEPGDYQVSVVEMKNIPNDYILTLIDHVLGKEYIIDAESTFAFSLIEEISESRRFELAFNRTPALSEQTTNQELMIYAIGSELVIDYPSRNHEEVSIFSLEGKRVFQDRVKFENRASIYPALSSGQLYILRIGDTSTKFIIH